MTISSDFSLKLASCFTLEEPSLNLLLVAVCLFTTETSYQDEIRERRSRLKFLLEEQINNESKFQVLGLSAYSPGNLRGL